MIDWKRGGWTGSLNAWVRREIREHFDENATARRARRPWIARLLHHIFDNGTFWRFTAFYAVFAFLIGVAEFGLAPYLTDSLFGWTGKPDIKPLLTNVASYLITAQVGVLGVISIAIGLVTIIAQRENALTDVQVYYHESLAFGVVAGSIALLAVLCAQLLWPVQFAVHWFGYGTHLQIFKLILTTVHIVWLLANLAGMAQFVATTLAFVQQTAREDMRERYTANVVLPLEMTKRLREQLYLAAGPQFVKAFWPTEGVGEEPIVRLGTEFSGEDVEIPLLPGKLVLHDVRMTWVRWAVIRWLRRCRASNPDQAGQRVGGFTHDLVLTFPPRLDAVAEPRSGLCRRKGGVPLSRRERLALRWAFKFRKVRDEA
jgi:hypothetical protein